MLRPSRPGQGRSTRATSAPNTARVDAVRRKDARRRRALLKHQTPHTAWAAAGGREEGAPCFRRWRSWQSRSCSSQCPPAAPASARHQQCVAGPAE
eukprot:928479-Rhodomonas_salina.2